METLYRKIRNTQTGSTRYYPVYTTGDTLPDGIWYIHSRPGVRGTTDVNYIAELLRIGDAKDIDITEICGASNIADEVMRDERVQEVWSRSHSLQDIVYATVGVLLEKSKTHKQ